MPAALPGIGFDENTTKATEFVDKNLWLKYPLDNSRLLRAFTIEAGLSEGMDPDVMVAKIAAYYQKNMPYTLNPGALKIGDDFVNDFLENKKKGYCAHFATTATLALRYMGVPARYVEGYAVSYENMINNSLMDITKKFSDYYDGYSEMGETAVIDVEVSDASAHAWVEIYDDEYGWKPVEVTPTAAEEDRSEFWSRFMNIFREGSDREYQEEAKRELGGRQNVDFFTLAGVKYVIYVLFALMATCIIIMLIKQISYRSRYMKASYNDKLIMEYARFLKKKRRKCIELRDGL